MKHEEFADMLAGTGLDSEIHSQLIAARGMYHFAYIIYKKLTEENPLSNSGRSRDSVMPLKSRVSLKIGRECGI